MFLYFAWVIKSPFTASLRTAVFRWLNDAGIIPIFTKSYFSLRNKSSETKFLKK